ncbi:hypothetical protein [Burkholderia multivorans]|uniref:hypothetical protein n=1 Tax=Burkholderia multivorans TaxID=87883 RepID=UPI0021BEA32E|nr:hypothetical protein [Burkholderia multivorans]
MHDAPAPHAGALLPFFDLHVPSSPRIAQTSRGAAARPVAFLPSQCAGTACAPHPSASTFSNRRFKNGQLVRDAASPKLDSTMNSAAARADADNWSEDKWLTFSTNRKACGSTP